METIKDLYIGGARTPTAITPDPGRVMGNVPAGERDPARGGCHSSSNNGGGQMAKWKVSKVTSVNFPGVDAPYGFTVVKEGVGPIAIFVYATQEACKNASKQIGLALEEAVSVYQYSPRPQQQERK